MKSLAAIMTKLIITACKRSLRRLCFHRCLSVHRGVSAPLHAGIHPPPADTPQADTPPRQTSPQADTPRADTPSGQTPLPAQWMLGYDQQADGTHPIGIHSCCWLKLPRKFHCKTSIFYFQLFFVAKLPCRIGLFLDG